MVVSFYVMVPVFILSTPIADHNITVKKIGEMLEVYSQEIVINNFFLGVNEASVENCVPILTIPQSMETVKGIH